MELLVATSNTYKLQELRKILPESFTIYGLADIGIDEEIPETGTTFIENALLKAKYLYKKLGRDCIADDSGLEVTALNGRPGVYSARYAGPENNSNANIDKLLNELKGNTHREACFRTVIAMVLGGAEHVFEGKITGRIAEKPSGTAGFGYDPVFIPDGYKVTFAEMTPEQKNSISHRAVAVKKLKNFLEGLRIH